MGFHRIVLPAKFIGYRSVIGPGHKTEIHESLSGLEDTRTIRWPQNRRRFEMVNELGVDDAIELQEFVIARRGSLHSFLLQDLSDFSSNSDHAGVATITDQLLGTGDASRTEFQLQKLYGIGSNPKTRIVNKPVEASVLVAVDGAGQTEGVDYAVDYQSGRISFTPGSVPPNGHDVTAGFLFYVQVRFAETVDNNFQLQWVSHDMVRLEAEAIEDRVPVAAGDRHEAFTDSLLYGGGHAFSPGSTLTLGQEFEEGRVLEIFAYSSVDVHLPDVQENGRWSTYPSQTRVAEGGMYFIIVNNHPTTTLTLKERFDPGGGFVWRTLLSGGTLEPGRIREVFLDEAGIWRAR